MKKTKKTMLIAAALTAAAGLAGCTEEPQNVYGPPNDYSQNLSGEEDPASVEESVGEESDHYDPDEEEIADVYGPPADYDEEDSGDPDDSSEVTEEDSYDPHLDEIPVVYGPPEDLG